MSVSFADVSERLTQLTYFFPFTYMEYDKQTIQNLFANEQHSLEPRHLQFSQKSQIKIDALLFIFGRAIQKEDAQHCCELVRSRCFWRASGIRMFPLLLQHCNCGLRRRTDPRPLESVVDGMTIPPVNKVLGVHIEKDLLDGLV